MRMHAGVADGCTTARCAHMSSCVHYLPHSLERIHYAHASVRGSIFRYLHQREGAAYGRLEDSWFARDAAALRLGVVVTDAALSLYNRTSGRILPPGLVKHAAAATDAAPSTTTSTSPSTAASSITTSLSTPTSSPSATSSSTTTSPTTTTTTTPSTSTPAESLTGTVSMATAASDAITPSPPASLGDSDASAAPRPSPSWLLGLHCAPTSPQRVHSPSASWSAAPAAPAVASPPSELARGVDGMVLAVRALALARRAWVHLPSNRSLEPPPAGFSAPASLLRHRSVLLLGDSTVRDLLSALTNTPAAEPWAIRPSDARLWSVTELGCAREIGSGCADCWACCGENCANEAAQRAGRRSFMTYSKRVASAQRTRRSWQDYEHRRVPDNVSVHFSWKPELHSDADDVAFATRFCAAARAPPAVIYVGKGLHDACRREGTGAQLRPHAETQLRRLASLLRCLPPTTLLVLRTPYYAAPLGRNASRTKLGATDARRVCVDLPHEAERLRAIRDAMVRLHRDGVFGAHAVLLDAYSLTRAAARQDGHPQLHSLDGHHYPDAVRRVELLLLWHAVAQRLDGTGTGTGAMPMAGGGAAGDVDGAPPRPSESGCATAL